MSGLFLFLLLSHSCVVDVRDCEILTLVVIILLNEVIRCFVHIFILAFYIRGIETVQEESRLKGFQTGVIILVGDQVHSQGLSYLLDTTII